MGLFQSCQFISNFLRSLQVLQYCSELALNHAWIACAMEGSTMVIKSPKPPLYLGTENGRTAVANRGSVSHGSFGGRVSD